MPPADCGTVKLRPLFRKVFCVNFRTASRKLFGAVPGKDTRLDGKPMTEEEFKSFYRAYGEEMGRLLRPLTPQIKRMQDRIVGGKKVTASELVGKIVERLEDTARERAKIKVRQERAAGTGVTE